VRELLDFLSYLRWRHEEADQTWFWSDPWQARYREAKEDLARDIFKISIMLRISCLNSSVNFLTDHEFRLTDRFKKDYKQLPSHIQDRVDQKLKFLLQDFRYPSLRVHKVQASKTLEFSVTMNYRVIFEIEGEYYVLLGVGPHKIVDQT